MNCITLKLFFDFLFFLSDRPTHPTFRVEGDGKRNILLEWPKQVRGEPVFAFLIFKIDRNVVY